MEEDIKSEFQKSGFSLADEAQVLQQCLAFCINYNLSPSDLVSHWEVYYLNRQICELKVEAAQMIGFQSHIQNEHKENLIKEKSGLHVYSSNDVDMLVRDEGLDERENIPSTPVSLSEQPYIESHSAIVSSQTKERSSVKGSSINDNRSTPFGTRANKFVVQSTFNPLNTENAGKGDVEAEDDNVIRRIETGERCKLKIHRSQPSPGCRFMYDKIEDKFIALENRIRKHISAFVASGLHGEPTDASLASQKSIFTVGMICCEGEGRLNKNSVLLQGSLEHSGGQRIRLDLHKLANYSLFPGQVLGVEGGNPSGHCLIVTRVIDYLPLYVPAEMPSAKKQAIDQEECLPGSVTDTPKRLSLIVAAGPFTTSDNLLYEPLAELLAYASRKPPQLLVLMGPFVDSEHPEIKNGTASKSFEDIFNAEVIARLQNYVEFMGPAVRIVLLPAARDANHDYVYPQPAFEISPPEEIKSQITSVANPSMFSANEVVVGCTSVDVLKHLSSEEISASGADASPGDRLGRLARHVLDQRSFYPLYPASTEVPLDLSLAPEALEISPPPDLLLAPSDLAPFVKVKTSACSNSTILRSNKKFNSTELCYDLQVLPLQAAGKDESGNMMVKGNCVWVNPGRLAKGVGGGTFAELLYDGSADHASASILRI